jgi:transcriptional regulator with XRE-family HTH domain
MRKRDPRDAEIGKRVRTLRLQRGMSQTELGDLLEITFQQVQKYENGSNRVSAGRLQRIAEILDVPITFFYSAYGDNQTEAQPQQKIDFDFLQSGDSIRLVRAYSRIRERGVRLELLRLTEAIAGEEAQRPAR